MRKLTKLGIKELIHLAKSLGLPLDELCKVASEVEESYIEWDETIKGKLRHLTSPKDHLRVVLDRLKNLLKRLELPDCLHGGVKGCSPVTNARLHTKKKTLVKFDIESFFPSITHRMVHHLFRERLGCSPDVARLLTRLTTYKGCVPHGSPTSTYVANLVISRMAQRLENLAKIHKASFTLFVDDGTLSGAGYLPRLRPLIDRIVRQEGFRTSPKPEKRQSLTSDEEQTVTGVRVNHQIDVPSSKLREVQHELDDFEREVSIAGQMDRKRHLSLTGKIRHIASLNAGAAHPLAKKLRKTKLSITGKKAKPQ